jgi:hypothetical protein
MLSHFGMVDMLILDMDDGSSPHKGLDDDGGRR